MSRFIAGIALLAAVVHAQDTSWRSQVGGVEASGSKRIPTAQVAALAGLKVGSVVGPNDVEAARQRLLKSGYFRSVGFSYRNAGYALIVTFTLEDVLWRTPVVFDNFVDQADTELIAMVARDVPSFDGASPDAEPVLKRIADALERIARDAKDPGTVAYALILDKLAGSNHWRFHLDRASGPLPVCSIALSGVSDANAPALADRKASLVGMDYSKDVILKFAKETFVPMLSVSTGSPVAVKRLDVHRAPATETCARGVAVTISF